MAQVKEKSHQISNSIKSKHKSHNTDEIGTTSGKKRRLRRKRALARQDENKVNEVDKINIQVKPKIKSVNFDTNIKEPQKKATPNVPSNSSKTNLKVEKNKPVSVAPKIWDTAVQGVNEKPNTGISNNMESKPRESVIAEREAKKLAKQQAKLQKNCKVEKNPSTKLDVTQTKCISENIIAKSKEKTDLLANTESNLSQTNKNNELVTKSTESVKISSKSVDQDNQTATKSREAIKAEREAKKLTKQLAKQLKNSSTDNAVDAKVHEKGEQLKVKQNSESEEMLVGKMESVAIVTGVEVEKDKATTTNETKSKAELRAERRAKQEAQRAAKENTKVSAEKIKEKSKVVELCKTEKTEVKKSSPITQEKTKVKPGQIQHKVKLFQHLYTEREVTPTIILNSKEVHSAMIRLGVQHASRTIVGSNARCISFLNALKQVVTDYMLPAKTEFARGLEAHLVPNVEFLKTQRPLSVSMINALKHFRLQLTQLPNSINDFDAKAQLNEGIDTYIKEQIEMAGQAISNAARKKIYNGDVVLTYACSSLIEMILKEAWTSGLQFRTVVVGSRPGSEGIEMLRRLTNEGLACTYIDISAISYVMPRISKVILGAGALLVNGSVMARVGTAQIALVANAFNVPTLVCCETYKFSERVQTDSFVYNEIGDPDDLILGNDRSSPLTDWKSIGTLTPLNLTYDVTPPDLVTAVITELAILPCTSVPVVLRFK